MANELVGTVTASPEGPLSVGLGNTLDIIGSFTLNGPSGDTVTSQSMEFTKVTPGAPLSWGNEAAVVNDTLYTKTFNPQSLGLTAGLTYTIRVTVSQLYAVNPPTVFNSNDILIKVGPWKEETATGATFRGGASDALDVDGGTGDSGNVD